MTKLDIRLAGLLIALFTISAAAFAQVHVSPLGNDTTGNGTEFKPYLTLKKALLTGNPDVRLEAGDYIFNEPTLILPNVVVTGGYYRYQEVDGSWRFIRSSQPTNFLVNVQTPQFQVLPRPAAFKVSLQGQLQWVTIKGGYYSVELLPGGIAFEVDFSGGILSSVLVQTGQTGVPSFLDRCRISGGGYGVRVENAGNLVLQNTLVENTIGRGAYFSGTGAVVALNSIFQKSNSFGAVVQGNSNVLFQDCVFRRNTSSGLLISDASPIVRGCLSQLNNDGISLDRSTGATIQNCTVSDNRSSGVVVNVGTPDFFYNIITNNRQYGIAERVQEDMPNGDPPAIQTGEVVDNLFFGNTNGAYLDEGATVLQTASEINGATNASAVTGSLVANPLFFNAAKGDYHLGNTSPAVDVGPTVVGFETDLDGNPRAVEIAGTGGTTTMQSMDLGAYETQTSIRTNFTTEFADTSSATDPSHPGETSVVQVSPRWDWNSSSPFTQLVGKILPGRLRLSSRADNSYGAMGRSITSDLTAQASQVVVVKTTIEADDAYAVALPRIRMNEIDHFDVTASMFFTGRRPSAPNFSSREYEFIYDIRQGGYASIPDVTKPTYRQSLSYDLLDFFLLPYHSRLDLTGLSVDFVDRATFNAQFSTTNKFWTFSPAETFEWAPGIAPPTFAQPVLSYDPSRQALRYEVFQDPSFSGWSSPVFNLPAGKLFRVQCHIASPLTPDLGPNFRLRMNSKFVDLGYELTILTFPGGSASPSNSGDLYTLYGRVPNDPELIEAGNTVPMVLSVEIFGFSYAAGRVPHAIMYLDDVTVSTTP